MLKHEPTFRPVEALQALAKLLDDPQDTEQAFRVVRALDHGHLDRLYRRFTADPQGRRLLEDRPSLLASTSDTAALAALPEGSLGRVYLAFCEREGITPGGLVEVSEDAERDMLPPDLRFIADRMRDSHDLWHVVTGCRTDLRGEVSVLAFTSAQTGSLGIGLLAMAGYLKSFTFSDGLGQEGRQLVRGAWRRGRAAEWLPVADWESLLTRPLEEVRQTLGVEAMPSYEPVYFEAVAA